jgi:DNA-binding transcriptional ArsR family regulator
MMLDVTAIESADAAISSLDPIRSRLLAELAVPSSATALGARIGLPRQKVNYHLRNLEEHGLIELAEERKKGNVTERIMRATAISYVITPAALPTVRPDPARSPDRLSASWLLSLAGRLLQDVGELITASARASKPLATFALDGEIRFASAADRAAFAEDLSNAALALVSRYHSESAAQGRDYRLVIAIHPSTTAPSTPQEN